MYVELGIATIQSPQGISGPLVKQNCYSFGPLSRLILIRASLQTRQKPPRIPRDIDELCTKLTEILKSGVDRVRVKQRERERERDGERDKLMIFNPTNARLLYFGSAGRAPLLGPTASDRATGPSGVRPDSQRPPIQLPSLVVSDIW